MGTKKIFVYITKYALTKGIYGEFGTLTNNGSLVSSTNYFESTIFKKSEFKLSYEDALKDAEEKRKRKLISLQKQMEKLKVLKFEKEGD